MLFRIEYFQFGQYFIFDINKYWNFLAKNMYNNNLYV